MSGSARLSEYAASPARAGGGFTLVELVITLAVLAILVALATPSFTALINGNRLTAQANELVADLQSARMEAIKRNRPVTLCPSADGANCGGGNWGRRIIIASTGAGTQLVRTSAAKDALVLGGDVNSIVFRPDGYARDAAGALLNANLTVCLPVTSPAENVRQVALAAGSRVSSKSAAHATPGSC